MKTRVISAIVVLAIMMPIFYYGGLLFNLTIYLLSVLGLKEFLDAMGKNKEVPIFVKGISYILLTLIVLTGFNGNTDVTNINIDFRIISAIFLAFSIPTILYYNNNKYNIADAFYLIGGVFFISLSFLLIMLVRNYSLAIIVYLFLITTITDTFALVTGKLLGKHKLTKISPNKTWEGFVGGALYGTFVASAFYITVINPSVSIFLIVSVTLLLSVLGQLGDLFFSAIKRHYEIKDFSNIMPGHGGILDRLDSIIFVLLGFMFFITIL